MSEPCSFRTHADGSLKKIRQKATREAQDVREDLKRKKQLEEIAKKKAEQDAEKAHKKAVLAKIQEDKARRRELAEQAGRGVAQPQPAAAPVAPSQPEQGPSKPSVSHNEARLRLQWAGGQTTKKLDADTTLFEVAQSLEEEFELKVTKFESTYPRKVFSGEVDLSKTLREAGLVPSAVLRVS